MFNLTNIFNTLFLIAFSLSTPSLFAMKRKAEDHEESTAKKVKIEKEPTACDGPEICSYLVWDMKCIFCQKNSFDCLPKEIINYIIFMLPTNDKINLVGVSKEFLKLINESRFKLSLNGMETVGAQYTARALVEASPSAALIAQLPNLTILTLNFIHMSQALEGMKNLTRLKIKNSFIDRAVLASLSNLKTVYFEYSKLEDEHFLALTPQINELECFECRFTNKTSYSISHLTNLTSLGGSCVIIDDENLAPLTNLTSLNLDYLEVVNLTGAGISSLVKLKELTLYELFEKIDEEQIAPLTNLTSLRTHHDLFSDETLRSLSNLQELVFKHESEYSDEVLSSLTNLRTLALPHTEDTPYTGAFLGSLTNLTHLNLNSSYITRRVALVPDLTSDIIMKLVNLRYFELCPGMITEDAIGCLAKMEPIKICLMPGYSLKKLEHLTPWIDFFRALPPSSSITIYIKSFIDSEFQQFIKNYATQHNLEFPALNTGDPLSIINGFFKLISFGNKKIGFYPLDAN